MMGISLERKILKSVEEQRLPDDFIGFVKRWFMPVAEDIAACINARGAVSSSYILGVQGCQGSGKSTFSHFLKIILEEQYQLTTAVLSIDDFYLTKKERQALSEKVHPLFVTRGVPGTHDVPLALSTIEGLSSLNKGDELSIPRFDKSSDDRAKSSQWDRVSGPVDVIIFEGWCVGLSPQDESLMGEARNTLESEEDAKAVWRTYANECLAKEYKPLFEKLDAQAVLQVPSFDCVYGWRLLQEKQMRESLGLSEKEDCELPSGVMSPEQIERFIAHYQRLTEHAIASMPKQADWLFTLLEDHSICDLTKKN